MTLPGKWLRTRRGGGGMDVGRGRLRRPRAPCLLTLPGRPKGPIPTTQPLPPLQLRLPFLSDNLPL
jgi:hypothetical protein